MAWRRSGGLGVWSENEEVVLEGVGREEAGVYTCTSHNILGVSAPRQLELKVLTTHLTPIFHPRWSTAHISWE